MKGFLSCLAALGWIGVLIYQIRQRRFEPPRRFFDGPIEGWAETYAMPQHPSRPTHDEIYRDRIDRAHRGGKVQCPAHGAYCARTLEARRTGLSQTDEDVGRRATINGSH